MGNFRTDKKLKRKKNHKDWRKKINILENWQEQNKNKGIGRSGGLPVRIPRKRKFNFSKKKKAQ